MNQGLNILPKVQFLRSG